MAGKRILTVQEHPVTVMENDFISLTEMTKPFGESGIIENWLRNRNTIEYLGLWEKIHNPNFNFPEFEGIKNQAGLNRFTLSVKQWVESTGAIGMTSKAGRYGGTYAHKDIAFEFGTWLSPEFKLYLITEFQRLKEEENRRLSADWQLNHTLSKLNYRIQTDAVKENLIPPAIPKNQEGYIYADEADLLNRVLFGMTAKEWRNANPMLTGNIRDYATVEQLIVLVNLENLNADYIKGGLSQNERAYKLSQTARYQLNLLINNPHTEQIKRLNPPSESEN